ncbi:hypothetical protein Bca4012_037117 [Brassica carinata]|uniref:RNase H type-1 domain-containing protein n=1 Tax=Brassica carinata TaxID=52824 RepID=A0A8X7WFU0_BRACI|nr:hypothetical protein Bca52824_010808 [Brassica carinata]
MLACFTDRAWDSGSKTGAICLIIKDITGAVILQDANAKRYVGPALIAEALALKTELEAETNQGLLDLRCYSDSCSLVSLLTMNSSSLSFKGPSTTSVF